MTRLFEFSISYKSFLDTAPLFGRNTLCRSVSARSRYQYGPGTAMPFPWSRSPLILLGYRAKGGACEFVPMAVLGPGWTGGGMLYTIEAVSTIWCCKPRMQAAVAGRGVLEVHS